MWNMEIPATRMPIGIISGITCAGVDPDERNEYVYNGVACGKNNVPVLRTGHGSSP